jgi:hypothetical protein
MSTITNATLRLFKAVPVDGEGRTDPQQTAIVNRQTIPKGYLVAPAAIDVFSREFKSGNTSVADEVEKLFGLDGDKLNSSFHKSFAKVRDASIWQLVTEQVMHLRSG